MSDQPRNPREQLLREAVTIQLKLRADGFRDALLIPISMVAALLGLVRGGAGCDAEFRRVIELGRRSERWINLFGEQEPLTPDSAVGSIDRILEQVESVVVEQRRSGKSAAEIRSAIRTALKRDAGGAEPAQAERRTGEGADEPPQ